jgi:hypothetical protein
MGSAYLYQYSSITMLPEVTGQTQISTSTTNIVVPLYPSLPANFVQGTPFQVPNQGHILSLPYQERSQDYYYNENTLGPKISLEFGSCLESYGTVPNRGSRAPVPQPEMVMVLKKVQSPNFLTPVSTSGTFHSGTAQPITTWSLQGE